MCVVGGTRGYICVANDEVSAACGASKLGRGAKATGSQFDTPEAAVIDGMGYVRVVVVVVCGDDADDCGDDESKMAPECG